MLIFQTAPLKARGWSATLLMYKPILNTYSLSYIHTYLLLTYLRTIDTYLLTYVLLNTHSGGEQSSCKEIFEKGS